MCAHADYREGFRVLADEARRLLAKGRLTLARWRSGWRDQLIGPAEPRYRLVGHAAQANRARHRA